MVIITIPKIHLKVNDFQKGFHILLIFNNLLKRKLVKVTINFYDIKNNYLFEFM